MCGMVLEAGKARSGTSETQHVPELPAALRIPANFPRTAAGERPPSSSGPSLLGLGATTQSGPSLDTLREKAFSGSSPRFVYEDAKPRRGRTLLLMFILAILIVGLWARYRYLGDNGETAKPVVTVRPPTSAIAPAEPQKQATEATNAPTAQPATSQPTAAPEKPTETAAKNVETTPSEAAPSKPPVEKAAAVVKQPARARARTVTPIRTAKPAAIVKQALPDTTGDAAFRKGDAYLYGRGITENCGEAIKNLKAASASGNAKARSTFGTMYATGHCVPRDLPTSYSWFALALRADPNNQVLEKDLTAVWNQMTPPERQLATKLKQ